MFLLDSSDLFTLKDPRAPISESFRTLRTNIQFSSLDKNIQTILVTSAGPGEGKSTVSSNLAVIMAEAGKKTLIIDCDLRKPRVHKIFRLSSRIGLSNILIGEIGIEDAVQKTSINNLSVLTSGTIPPNPAELMGSAKMKSLIKELRGMYDCIILDTPPVVVVTDAQLLSTSADGCLLVVSSGKAERDASIKSKQLLEKVNAKILGVVLNRVNTKSRKYYGYYYHYYEENGVRTKKKVARRR